MDPTETANDFSTLFEFLPVGAYRTRPDGRMLRANPALVRMNGFASEAEQLAAASASEWYVQPGRRAQFMREVEARDQVIGFESEVRRRVGGERIWIRENAHVVRDAAGRALYYEGTVEEITDRVRDQQALADSEQRLREITAQMPGVLYCGRVHANGHRSVEFVSDGVGALLGVEPEELRADYGLLDRLRHPEDRERVRLQLEAAFRRREPLLTEYRVCLRDGSERWVQQASSPSRVAADGSILRYGVILDITERKRIETALRASEQRWQLALESTGDGVWDWNLVTGEELLSPRCLEMYGYEEHGLPSRIEAHDDSTHPDDVASMRRARDAHVAGLSPSYVHEHRIRCRDGSWKWVLSRGMIIERDTGGRPLRMIGTHTDITERKQAEALRRQRDEAAAADHAKTLFLSRVSHELRTPLNAILGFAQLLEMQMAQPERAARDARELGWLRQVLASGRHLLTLMDDILDLSSAQTGLLSIAPEAIALRPAVEQALDFVGEMAREAGVGLVDALPPELALTVRADRRRLTQILSNLLGNGVKYNRRGGTVRVEVAGSEGGAVRLRVIDDGPGIPEALRPRLFQPFERLGAQRSAVPGTGLGLALSRQLAEAMGGSLTLEARPCPGASFLLTLPAA
jgi:PAS domain S-box-containing protein